MDELQKFRKWAKEECDKLLAGVEWTAEIKTAVILWKAIIEKLDEMILEKEVIKN